MVRSFLNFWALLSRTQRSQTIGLALATFVGALLEMAGVGAVPIFVGLLSDPEKPSAVTSWVLSLLGNPSVERAITTGGVLLFLLFVVKNVYGSWLILMQSKFANRCFVELSTRLLERYLQAPYEFFLRRNSAELLRNTNQETISLVQNVLLPAIMLVTECLVALCIGALVLSMEPMISLLAFALLGGSSWAFWLLVRRKSQLLGQRQLAARGRMIQAVAEALGGVKEVKVLGREHYFMRNYTASVNDYAHAAQYNRLAAQIPRPFIETVAIAGLLLVGAVFLWQGRPVESIVQTLALFAIAVVRLMPSAQRIMAALASVRFNLPSLDVVVTELSDPLPIAPAVSNVPANATVDPAGVTSGPKAIMLNSVTFSYANQARPALNSFSFTIPRNRMVGFVGPSGSGKSTLMDVVLGLLVPQSGSITVDGIVIDRADALAWWHRQVGYIPQSIYLADSSIAQNVAFGIPASEIVEANVWSALEAAQLADFVRQLPEGLDTHVGERGIRISGGQRQRIGIARALYHRPTVLIMDEATSALDSATEREFVQAIERLRIGTTILVVAHRLSTIQSCDTVCVITDGRVSDSGTFDELRARGSVPGELSTGELSENGA